MKYSRYTLPVILILMIVLTGLMVGGCTKRLEGETAENIKPLVWFVNVPPEDALSSVNPIINWVGQDKDGLIDFYRYFVAQEGEIVTALGLTPGTRPTDTDIKTFVTTVISTMADTLWTMLDVTTTDPKTSNIIPLQADLGDPVNTIVAQVVFVQAFDEEGLASDVAFRRFRRIDNPPSSRIVGLIPNVPFINSVVPQFAATGIRIRWTGDDIADFPTDPPPFEFEWKLLGPYTDSMVTEIQNNYIQQVFVTTDAQIFEFGTGDSTCWVDTAIDTFVVPPETTLTDRCIIGEFFVTCDTSFVGGVEVEDCDTIIIDDIMANNVFGRIDTLIGVFDTSFMNNPVFYQVADSSFDDPNDTNNTGDRDGDTWVLDTRDSMFNVFRDQPSDTTQELNFLFAVRSRDDALVPDLTPSFAFMRVIDAKNERDVLLVQMTLNSQNSVIPDEARRYWKEAIDAWSATRSENIVFDTTVDYKNDFDIQQSPDLLRILLSHKIVIPTGDVEKSHLWSQQLTQFPQAVYVALQTGMSSWLAARVPFGGPAFGAPSQDYIATNQMRFFYGTEQYSFSGWGFFGLFQGTRVEHFKGTLTLDENRWPELSIDTARLHNQYKWSLGWVDSLGALPEVGWMVRTFETEVLYLYKSLYGQNHFLGNDLSFHGRPVAHRLNRGVFRTMQTLFTPQAFEQSTAQVFVNRSLDWLYAPFVTSSSSRTASNSTAAVSNEELGRVYWECYWAADGDKETFHNLLEQSYYR